MKMLALILTLVLPAKAFASMNKGDLRAALALADAKGLPDTAPVQVNGVTLNSTYHIELGKFMENGSENVETVPALMLVQ